MREKQSNWALVLALHSSPPPKAKSEPAEKDSFSLSSLVSNFSNLWTKDAPAESKPLLSGKNISLRDKR